MNITIQNESTSAVMPIPDDWLKAATYFAELRNEVPLTDDIWSGLLQWLRETPFDARSVLAGEVAAGLVRDHAPMHIKDHFLADDPSDEWRRHFQKIAVSPLRPFSIIERSSYSSPQVTNTDS